tara:strand:- start:343 stop:510 length:168 start_codon:yes stop_codon:yes gene_type:complete
MSKNLKIGTLALFILSGLALVYFDKASLTEFATAMTLFLALVVGFEERIKGKDKN